jgi:predicted ester cyclase/2-polyprenyl-3-methyl-5-hydroxy-6-metoxy-1,4-benzoquinol methylase
MAEAIAHNPAALVTDVIKRTFEGDPSALDGHPGMASLRQHFPAFKAAFPDIKAELQQTLVDGDRVAMHWMFSGTHSGSLFGIPPTGKTVRMQNVGIARVEGDRVVQYNSEVGWLTALTQIGALPATGGAIGARPSGPDRLLAMSTGNWVTQILLAACHYKFFTLIAKGQTTVDAIAGAAKTDARGTRAVLDSLAALEILTKRGEHYGLTPDADAYLVEGRPGDLTPMLEGHSAINYADWGRLTEALQDPTVIRQYGDLDKGAAFFAKLIRAIIPLGLGPADATAEHLGIGETRKGSRILDIGVGGAAWSIPFARRDKSARVTGFDMPDVLPHTKQIVAEFGVDRQYTFTPGNLMQDDFGDSAFDIVILGNICHGLTAEQNVDLLKRCYRALAPQGRLVIADMLPNEERTGPPFPVLFAVNMFVMGGEDTYPMSAYRTWLRSAGYRDVEALDTGRSHSPVLIASK